MTIDELLEYFDNWNMNIVINYFCEHQLNPIYKNKWFSSEQSTAKNLKLKVWKDHNYIEYMQ